MSSWSLLGLKLALSEDVAAAERSLSVSFSPKPQRQPDLTVRFFRKALPRRCKDEIPGVGFHLDPAERRLDYLLPKRIPLAKRRLAFVYTVAFAYSIAAGNQAKRYILALHASGVAGRKGALVFCGYSTYGKSTISGLLARRCPKVGDDRMMFLCEQKPRAKGPRIRIIFFERYVEELFSGAKGKRTGAPWALPVAGLFWLHKSREFSLETMGRAEGMASILPPIGHTDAETSNKVLWLKRLTKQSPCLKLRFAKDREGLIRFLKANKFL